MAISTSSPAVKQRPIRKISVHNFKERREEIARQIIDAAEKDGFFAIKGQESPSPKDIEEVFQISKRFFALPDEIKAQTPLKKAENAGWECRSQIRPSTGTPDQKQSIQLQYHRRNDNSWPADEALLAEDKATLCRFMEKTHALSQEILSIFAEALGFPSDYFAKAHQVTLPDAQSTLRLLHYHDITGTQYPASYWRAGAHTDFDCMTMLFQRTGEDGLEVCPGREAHTSFARGDAWTPIEPVTGEIV